MNELIKREDAIKATWHEPSYIDPYNILTEVRDRIEALPTVDAVPVVRCKDCKWFKSGIDIDGKPFTKCIGANGSVRTYGHTAPDWFCADGERRTNGKDSEEA